MARLHTRADLDRVMKIDNLARATCDALGVATMQEMRPAIDKLLRDVSALKSAARGERPSLDGCSKRVRKKIQRAIGRD